MRRPSPQAPLCAPSVAARRAAACPRAVSFTALGLTLLWLAAATAGCSRDDATTQAANVGNPGSALSAISVPGSAPLAASLGGSPLRLQSALLRSFGGKARLLTLSTANIACSELGAWREQGAESTINLVLAPQLQPNGGSRWAVTSATYEHTTRRGDLGAVTISADTVDKPVDISLALDLIAPVSTPSGSKNRQLVLNGKLRATGCGERGSHPDVKIREQSDMQWTVAGTRFTARGATVSYQPGGAVLRLSSEPHSCTTSLSGSDITLTLQLDGPPPVAKRLVLGGSLLGSERRAALSPVDFSARLDESPTGPGFAHVTVQGASNAGGFEVVLEGVADAMVCAPKK